MNIDIEKKPITDPISLEEAQSVMGDQLWSLYFDNHKHNCIGIIELSTEFFNNKTKIDFDKTMPLAFLQFDKLPQEEEARMNILADLAIISCCPNIYLFLEAIHENKSEEVSNFHLNAYEKVEKMISPNILNVSEKTYKSLDRVNEPFTWTSNSKGYLINQHGQKVAKFIDPKLAKWVSIAGSQFAHLFKFIFQDTLSKVGFGGSFISLSGSGSMTLDSFEHQATRDTKAAYLEMKSLLKELDWDINQNLKNMKIFLE